MIADCVVYLWIVPSGKEVECKATFSRTTYFPSLDNRWVIVFGGREGEVFRSEWEEAFVLRVEYFGVYSLSCCCFVTHNRGNRLACLLSNL